MANKNNQSAQSQGGSGQRDGEHDQDGQTVRGPGEGQREAQPGMPGQYDDGAPTGRGPGEGQRSAQQQQVELPEHQGVMTDYVPPRGGMRTEVGDLDVDGQDNQIESPEAGDEPLPGHMGGGLAGG